MGFAMIGSRLRSCLWALAALWVAGTVLWSYPAFREEVEEKRYLARVARRQVPVIPVDCAGARGVESRDFIREDRNPHRCWVDLASFRRLYPEIAASTDEATSVRLNVQAELPADGWDGSPWEELLKAAALGFSLPLLLLAGAAGLPAARRLRRLSLAIRPARPAEAA
ncbi:MAG TPA: hypothetical protein VF601_21115 [Beijerinckiaceae bacterium]|jgi:hypothetical protein